MPSRPPSLRQRPLLRRRRNLPLLRLRSLRPLLLPSLRQRRHLLPSRLQHLLPLQKHLLPVNLRSPERRSFLVSRMNHLYRGLITGLPLICALAACSRVSERMEITESREISTYEAQPKLFADAAERFGEERLRWKVPDGWAQAERSQMRPVNLTFGPKGEGECYLSMLPGGAGGVLANVNRWRKQMGQPDITQEELDKLPKKRLMGIEGVFVQIDGNYTGVGAAEAKQDFRMLGVVAALQEVGLFVKMVGPKDVVAANEAGFDQFVESLSLRMPSGGSGM